MFPPYVVFRRLTKIKIKCLKKEGFSAFFRVFNHQIHTKVFLFVLHVVLLSKTHPLVPRILEVVKYWKPNFSLKYSKIQFQAIKWLNLQTKRLSRPGVPDLRKVKIECYVVCNRGQPQLPDLLFTESKNIVPRQSYRFLKLRKYR